MFRNHMEIVCLFKKKTIPVYLKIQVNIKINYLSFKIFSIATIYILGLVFAVSLPSHEHYRFCIKYVLEQDN
jgi:hypothetical protein